jgi:hypothetical protein
MESGNCVIESSLNQLCCHEPASFEDERVYLHIRWVLKVWRKRENLAVEPDWRGGRELTAAPVGKVWLAIELDAERRMG